MARKYAEPDREKFKSRYGSFDASPVERVSDFGGKVEEIKPPEPKEEKESEESPRSLSKSPSL